MATQIITSFSKDVTGFTDLERLDVFYIDVIGQVSSHLISAMEIVRQNVRDIWLPIGFELTIMTGDSEQLKSPDDFLK